MFGLRRKSAVSGTSHLQYEERKCAIPSLLHLQYKQRVVQCEEKVYSTRIAPFAIGEKGVWCEEKVCSARMVASAVRGEKCAAPEGSHLQYKEKIVQCERKCTVSEGYICSRRTEFAGFYLGFFVWGKVNPKKCLEPRSSEKKVF